MSTYIVLFLAIVITIFIVKFIIKRFFFLIKIAIILCIVLALYKINSNKSFDKKDIKSKTEKYVDKTFHRNSKRINNINE
jgi:energy-coupling factor transporter transmembrane protein EcfT